MGLLGEFRDFAMRGNVVDMAVGIIIGAAFGDIVNALVKDVMMPGIGALTAGVDFSTLSVKIPADLKTMADVASSAAGVATQPGAAGKFIELKYGILINTIIKFIIVAFALFMIIKAMNRLKRKQETAPPPAALPTPTERYLSEIRDLLAKKS